MHAHLASGTGEGRGHMRKLSAATFASTDGEATVAGDHDPRSARPTSATSFKDSNLLGADLNRHGYDFNPNRSRSHSDSHSRRTSITIAAHTWPRQGSSAFNFPDSPTALKKGTLSVPANSMTDTSTLRSRTAGGDGQEKGDKTKNGKGDENPAGSRVALDPSADTAASDPRPFAKQYGPYALASLVDPKNLDALRKFGSVNGLLRGLGSNRRTGLHIVAESRHAEKESLSGRKGGGGHVRNGAGDGAGKRHERDLEPGAELQEKVNEDVFMATTADRQRVYGHSILSIQQSKSHLLLMCSMTMSGVFLF